MPSHAELFTVLTPLQAWEKLATHLKPGLHSEIVSLENGLGRVLSHDLTANESLPEFRRSTVDGYAVVAADTFGASPGLPALISVIGEALMGEVITTALGVGSAVLVHTGSMLPLNATAVVMIEHTQRVLGDMDSGLYNIEVMRPVADGDNIFDVGEDVQLGQTFLRAGHVLRPQDLGALAAIGMCDIAVIKPIRVGIISTGDEVVAPSHKPKLGQIRDVNSIALASLCVQHGAQPCCYGIVPDDRDALARAARRAKDECDVVVLSAGSSVSYRDMSVEIIDALGAPGVLVHGVSVKPGKPTIIAVADGKPIFGLPGNPVSAITVFELLVAPTLHVLMGRGVISIIPTLRARLTRNIASTTGREDYVQVALEKHGDDWHATPVLGKPNQIFTMVRAQGTVCVPLNANGLQAGEWVEVQL